MKTAKTKDDNAVIERIDAFSKAAGDKYGMTLSVFYGRKYAKVERANAVYCFINLENGDVLKAATYSSPAKHARSNIYDADFGVSGVNEYGANYILR